LQIIGKGKAQIRPPHIGIQYHRPFKRGQKPLANGLNFRQFWHGALSAGFYERARFIMRQ
jgi:uncharacterized Fe-S cluster-containing radical SAM superfamily enzyme